ncbi:MULTISPECIES: hypothetical protein [unclassified Clostridium]|uniref:hypothetical protein n=1 Tax=unclassified Clostridium TaxID=2614128 RepID=UPI0025C155B8|nr:MULTISPECIES: hypothetical protein [unclassified Clostridium]
MNEPIIKSNGLDTSQILIKKREDGQYIQISEEVKIVHNIAILTEIPNSFYKVKINGMYEIDKKYYNPNKITENQYWVNYNLGLVYFNSAKDNQTLTVEYQGTGIVLYPASRIYTKYKDNIVETLQVVIDAAKDSIIAIEKLEPVVKDAEQLYTQLNTVIKDGKELNNKLLQAIEDGRIRFDELTKLLKDINAKIQELSTLINNANTSKSNLEKTTINANNKKDELEIVITNATNINDTLAGNVTSGTNKIQEIDNKVEEVNNRLSEINIEEEKRIVNEKSRIEEETKRESAENERIANEKVRQEEHKNIKNTVDNFSVLEEYNNTKKYMKYNRTTYGGSSYECLIDNTIGILPINKTNWTCIAMRGADGEGSGDMLKEVYDTDGDGVIDTAKTVNGHTVESNVPPNAHFTDTIYDDSEIKELLNKKADVDENGKVLLEQLPSMDYIPNDEKGKTVATLVNGKVPSDQLDLKEYGAGDMMMADYDSDGDGIVDNAKLVNGHTVECDVPADAKLTDTIYVHPDTHNADMIKYANGKNAEEVKTDLESSINDKASIDHNHDEVYATLKDGKIPIKQIPDGVGYKYVSLESSVKLDKETQFIPINIEHYNIDEDSIEVHLNGWLLEKNKYYQVVMLDGKPQIKNIDATIKWEKDDDFHFKLGKNVASTIGNIDVSLIPNDSIQEEKLEKSFVDKVKNKVDKIEGKDLSSNDFTDTYKEKIDEIIKNIDNGNSGGEATGVGLKQIEQIGVIGSPENPKIISIPINTVDFKVPRVNVLKNELGEQNIIAKNEFSNSDFKEDENIIFDDKVHLKLEHEFKYNIIEDTEDYTRYSIVVDLDNFRMIDNIENIEDGIIKKLELKAIPNDTILTPKNDMDLSHVERIDYFKLKANGSNIKIVCSVDSGKTWKTFKSEKWDNINLNLEDIKEKGMAIDLFNSINDVFWNDLLTTKKIRFAYLFSMDDISQIEELEDLSIKYDGQGKWVQAKETDFDVIYASNTLLQVYIKFDGNIKINY